VSVITAISL